MKIHKSFLIIATGTLLVACGSEQEENNVSEETIGDAKIELIDDPLLAEKTKNIENIIYSIPTPNETMKILQESGAIYDIQLTNDPFNIDNYTTRSAKAFNLGVYGADMNYCSSFDKTADMMASSRCAEDLASKLGLDDVFSKDIADRLYENSEDKDSVNAILASSFWELESKLTADDRPELAAMIIIGGWIEGMNIACGQAKVNEINDAMIERIAEQELALESVIKLGKMYSENNEIQNVVNDLEELAALYKKIEKTKTEGNNTTNDDGSLTIGGKTTYKVAPEVLEEITVKVFKMREAIIGL